VCIKYTKLISKFDEMNKTTNYLNLVKMNTAKLKIFPITPIIKMPNTKHGSILSKYSMIVISFS
jgi:hypothetical protein